MTTTHTWTQAKLVVGQTDGTTDSQAAGLAIWQAIVWPRRSSQV